MPVVGFEPTISAGERPKTYALDRAATGTGSDVMVPGINMEEGGLSQALFGWVVKWMLNDETEVIRKKVYVY